MTTPDPIALPEPKFGEWLRGIYASEKNPHRDGMYVRTILRDGRFNPGKYYEVTDGKGDFWTYLAESTMRTSQPEASDTVTVPRELTLDMLEAAEQEIAMGNDFADAWEAAIATHLFLRDAAAPPTPPLNQLLGQPEEFNLNEVSGNPGQLASLEQRARELLAIEYEASGFPRAAAWIRNPDRALTYAERSSLNAITAALSAQLRGVEEVAEYQYRCPKALDKGWRRMTQQEYEATIATGHACGNATWTRDVEVRKLYAAPPRAVVGADIYMAYETWPEDIRKKLSFHDLRRMDGWSPKPNPTDWRIDTSAGGPILVYQDCSVIEGEQARYLLRLIQNDTSTTPQDAAGVERRSDKAFAYVPYHLIDSIAANLRKGGDAVFMASTKQDGPLDLPLYTTPPPGVDVGKLRELRSLLVGIRPEFGQPGSRDVDVRAQQNRIDAAIAIIDGAAPGVGEAVRSVCKWSQQDEGYEVFSTSCGHEYQVNDCTDGNVQLPFCPFCARRVEGSAWAQGDDPLTPTTPPDGAKGER